MPETYEEALMRLGVLLEGAERDFVRRVLWLLVEKRHEFMRVVLRISPTVGANDALPARFDATERMDALLAAARERDVDRLAIIEHELGSG